MGGTGTKQRYDMRQQMIQKAYDYIEPVVSKEGVKPVKKDSVKEECPKCEVCVKPVPPKLDVYDQGWVWMRTWVPDPLLPIILIAGLYAVFHKPVNYFFGTVFGFTLEDIKYAVKRRKERDEELKKDKTNG